MNIPKIWAKAESKIIGPRGPMSLTAWGWSHNERQEAARLADQRLRSLVGRVQQSRELERGYGYGTRPFREEIVQEIHGRAGDLTAIVTRNSYGCLVLNTSEVMFVDVDLPRDGAAGRIWNLFGKKRDVEKEYSDRIKTAVSAISTASFRIYRTAAGFRLLFTDRLFKPGSAEAETIMAVVSADPAYIKLCRLQESFRARLTPKPWRCNATTPPNTYPRDGNSEQASFDHWLKEYEQKIAGKGTCRLMEEINRGWMHEQLRDILDLHDKETKANASLTLA